MVFAFHRFLFDIYIFFNAHEQRKLTHAEGQILLFMNYGYYHRDYLFILYYYMYTVLRDCTVGSSSI